MRLWRQPARLPLASVPAREEEMQYVISRSSPTLFYGPPLLENTPTDHTIS